MAQLEDLKQISERHLEQMDLSAHAKSALRGRAKDRPSGFRSRRKGYLAVPAVVLALALVVTFINPFSSPLKVHAQDLMSGIQPSSVEDVPLSDDFIRATAGFSLKLFRETQEGNSLLSPLSAALALGMTAAGAQGETRAQFEELLGGGLETDALAACYRTLSQRLSKNEYGTLHIANSIWYRDADWLDVKQSFLQTNADYFGADAYRADFGDPQTVKDINNWAKNHTDGLIDRMVEKIDDATVLYLFNALLFNMKWDTVYEQQDVSTQTFTLEDGTALQHEFMSSREGIYLSDSLAEGFLKFYEGGKYSFAALLPREGSLDEFIRALDGERFLAYLRNASQENVLAYLPRFSFEDEIDLVEPLKRLGLTDGFDPQLADLSAMAQSEDGNLYIGDVLQKTYISVDTQGTKAGAVTKVEINCEGAAISPTTIRLDHPFVFAIVDNETGLPLFLGTVRNPAGF